MIISKWRFRSNKKPVELLEAMHKIVFPGEYGNGKEEGSFPDDREAWFELGKLIEQMFAQLKEGK